MQKKVDAERQHGIAFGYVSIDHPADKMDEGIHQSGEDGRGKHVAVIDVTHLMSQNGPDFVFVQMVQQAGGDRNHRVVFRWPRGKGIGVR